MEQHPVPQQISSYEFRLVGDMTLKQFGMVAGGGMVALLLYASPLPGFLKWPFLIIVFFTGIAFAFLPFEERPLQTWVIAFLKAVYSPTQYLWHKKPQKPAFFEDQPLAKMIQITRPIPVADTQKLAHYLADLAKVQSPLEQKEKVFIDHIQNLFQTTRPLPQMPEAPKPQVQPQAWIRPSIPIPPRRTFPKKYVPPLPGNVFHPQSSGFTQARFSQQMPLPTTPSMPNVLVGMVLDQFGKMVEGAIMEIRDSQGNPVRAFRTNKLGQFQIVTPLPNDVYEVEIEKEGLKFDIIKIALTGEIVQPIEIRARDGGGEVIRAE